MLPPAWPPALPIDETVEILGELIAFPTVSAESNLAIIEDLAARLEEAGARVLVLPSPDGRKANLFASIGPKRDGGIVLSGHTDVVPVADQDWSSDPFAMREADGLLYGRGSCDMKGFIAAAVAMAPRFAALELTRPIHFAFTYDEEVGCIGARQLMVDLDAHGIRPSLAIIGEPTEMRIIEGHKGCCEYTAAFTGLEGHGSAPDRGVSAIEYAVRYAARLLELAEALKSRAPEGSRFDPPWSTINIGRLSGGVAHNVIAGKAEVEWDLRPVRPEDGAFVKERIAAYCDEVLLPAMRAVSPEAGIETRVIGEVEGLVPAEENEARRILAELTGANTADVVAFGTEAGLFQAAGMSVVVCGPGSIEQAHKPDEFVARDQLAACLAMLARLGQKYSLPAAR